MFINSLAISSLRSRIILWDGMRLYLESFCSRKLARLDKRIESKITFQVILINECHDLLTTFRRGTDKQQTQKVYIRTYIPLGHSVNQPLTLTFLFRGARQRGTFNISPL